ELPFQDEPSLGRSSMQSSLTKIHHQTRLSLNAVHFVLLLLCLWQHCPTGYSSRVPYGPLVLYKLGENHAGKGREGPT
ncbi:hypothetical protein SK128_018704, partial [Halocaridina rubra]